MSKLDKILDRLKSGAGTITFHELEYVLSQFGFKQLASGKTSGSRVAWYHKENHLLIRLHRPHPGNELKQYQRRYIKSFMIENGFI